MKTVYKILGTICYLAVFPVMYFLPLIRFHITSSFSESLMSSLNFKEYLSLSYIVKMLSNTTEQQDTLITLIMNVINNKESKISGMFTNKPWIIAALVFAALMLVLCLATAVITVVTKKVGLSVGLGAGSIVSALLMNFCFKRFAEPLLSGKISLANLISGTDTSTTIVSSLLGGALRIDALQLAVAFSIAVMLLVIAIIIGVCALFEKNFEK